MRAEEIITVVAFYNEALLKRWTQPNESHTR